MIKKACLIGFLLLTTQNNFSQIIRTEIPDSTSNWTKENKVGLDTLIDASKLIKDKYILVQKGKKNYHLVVFN